MYTWINGDLENITIITITPYKFSKKNKPRHLRNCCISNYSFLNVSLSFFLFYFVYYIGCNVLAYSTFKKRSIQPPSFFFFFSPLRVVKFSYFRLKRLCFVVEESSALHLNTTLYHLPSLPRG